MILVTGGAGFIGSHLCERLLRNGEKVVIVDNMNDFYDPGIKRDNLRKVSGVLELNDIPSDSLVIVEGDIRDLVTLNNVFGERSFEMVIHLAAMAGVRPSITKPMLYNEVNVTGTLNLLEMCRKYGVDKFLFASSSSVYGNNAKVPFAETDNVDYPISPYAATKKAGELLCYTYHKLYNIDVVCLRFFTVYGPRQRPDLAIHKFTRLIFRDEPIPFYGDGTTERDYTYIEDIIDGVWKSIQWIRSGKGKYEIFNLGESKTISLKQMVDTLEKVIGKSARIERLPMQPGDVMRTYADISKSRRVLGYDPKTDFEAGIRKFIEWYTEVNDLSGG